MKKTTLALLITICGCRDISSTTVTTITVHDTVNIPQVDNVLLSKAFRNGWADGYLARLQSKDPNFNIRMQQDILSFNKLINP